MNNINTLVFGCSGLIGVALSRLLRKSKTLFLSRTKPKNINNNWKKIDLDKSIKDLPRNVEKIFFLSSPYYTISNLRKNNIYSKEFGGTSHLKVMVNSKDLVYWLRNVAYE